MTKKSNHLESGIQSEGTQKEKNKYRILMHICKIQTNAIDDLICKAERDTVVEDKCMDTRGKDREELGRWD